MQDTAFFEVRPEEHGRRVIFQDDGPLFFFQQGVVAFILFRGHIDLRPARFQPAKGAGNGCIHDLLAHPMAPFISMRMRLFISTAYSSGSSLETFSAKPLTISAFASSSDRPLLIR